jgi:hypothetical protein
MISSNDRMNTVEYNSYKCYFLQHKILFVSPKKTFTFKNNFENLTDLN